MKKLTPILTCLLLYFVTLTASAADWNQWRGANRDGVAVESPALRDALPAAGLKPVWLNGDVKGRSGGWSSPVVADGRVYLFTHSKTKVGDVAPKKYPWLPPEKRVGMTDEEYQEYERQRRDEDEARAKSYRFDEIVYCLSADTGKLLWKNERLSVYTRFSQSGSPAVIDGRVYILGAGRLARCIDAASGDNVWQQELPGDFRDEFLQSSFARGRRRGGRALQPAVRARRQDRQDSLAGARR